MTSSGPWEISATITSMGALRQVTVSVGDISSIPAALWAGLDNLLTEGTHELSSFNVSQSIPYLIHVGFKPDDAPFAAITGPVLANMPNMKRSGKLCFYDFDRRNRCHVRVHVDESIRNMTPEDNAGDGMFFVVGISSQETHPSVFRRPQGDDVALGSQRGGGSPPDYTLNLVCYRVRLRKAFDVSVLSVSG